MNNKKKHGNVAVFIPHAGCPHTCSFCNQRAISGSHHSATLDELNAACELGVKSVRSGRFDRMELAFFGGSFTAIPQDEMTAYLEAAQKYIKNGYFSGIRISTRPDYINNSILELLRRHNVTAIELGAQSMDDEVLSRNLRGHTTADVARSAALVKAYGFELGLQMMTGLYESSPELDRLTARQIAALSPDTVRVYPTVVMRETHLYNLYKLGSYTPPTLEENITLSSWMIDFFEIKNNIKIIKLGLHSSEEIGSGSVSEISAYHPAFRELCESRLMRERLENRLNEPNFRAGGEPTEISVKVRRDMVSAMVGHKRENILFFNEIGYDVKVLADSTLEFSDKLSDKYTISLV